MLLIGILCSLSAKSQTWSELFEQKKTQEKYLLLQLVALKVQSGLLEDATQIFQSGLGLIGAWKDGEFLGHQNFFEEWSRVGPKSAQVLTRISDEGLLPDQVGKRIRYSRTHWKSRGLEAEFWESFSALHLELQRRCLRLGDAFSLLGSDKLEIEDAERAELLVDLEQGLFKLSTDLNRLQLMGDMHLKQREFENSILESLNEQTNSSQ